MPRDGEFVFHPAAEQEVEIVREEKAARGEIPDGGELRERLLELQARVVKDVRNACRVKDWPGCGAGCQTLESVLCAGVAVGVYGEDEPAFTVEQDVIDAPGVHSDRGELRETLRGFDETGADLVPQSGEVPVVVAVERLEGVCEAVDLRERELVSSPLAHDNAATRGPEIDRCAEEGHQRRKASCRPPSTVMIWPVVLLRRWVTRRKYASAWSSGVIGVFVSVRSA